METTTPKRVKVIACGLYENLPVLKRSVYDEASRRGNVGGWVRATEASLEAILESTDARNVDAMVDVFKSEAQQAEKIDVLDETYQGVARSFEMVN
jgi:hypothetical protein